MFQSACLTGSDGDDFLELRVSAKRRGCKFIPPMFQSATAFTYIHMRELVTDRHVHGF